MLPVFRLFQSSKNDFRRKWDKDEYENLAQKRLAEERDRERRDGEEMTHNRGSSVATENVEFKKPNSVERHKCDALTYSI